MYRESEVKEVRVGIFGGMGVLAADTFQQKFHAQFAGLPENLYPIEYTYSNPRMPRKDAGVVGTGADPLPYLLKGIDFFWDNRVSILLAPCNTLMFYYDALQDHIKAKRDYAEHTMEIVNIVDEVALYIAEEHPRRKHIGIMSTVATAQKSLYVEAIHKHISDAQVVGLHSHLNSHDLLFQGYISEAIESIKLAKHEGTADEQYLVETNLRLTMGYLKAKGADVIVKGCTELSCAVDVAFYGNDAIPIVDSSLVLAEAGFRRVMELQYGILDNRQYLTG